MYAQSFLFFGEVGEGLSAFFSSIFNVVVFLGCECILGWTSHRGISSGDNSDT